MNLLEFTQSMRVDLCIRLEIAGINRSASETETRAPNLEIIPAPEITPFQLQEIKQIVNITYELMIAAKQ